MHLLVELGHKMLVLGREERQHQDIFKRITYKILFIVSSDLQKRL